MSDQDVLVIPEGKVTGCLPRVTRLGECCSLFAERLQVIPQQEWAELIGTIELRSSVTKIKDQDGVGSCATESTSQAVEIIERMAGYGWVELNPWFIYNTTSGGRDQGSNIDRNLEFVRENGVAPESIWPRSKGWRATPSSEAKEMALDHRIGEFYDCTTTAEIGSALLYGFPVVFGWNGHSCVLTQLVNATTAEYANSWSTGWGDSGFGQIRLASINFQYGAFAVRTVDRSLEGK